MSELPIPSSIDDITPEWLTAALNEGGEACSVASLDQVEIGAGLGVSASIYRITPTYSSGSGPETVIAKVRQVDELAAMRSFMLQFYQREASYFRDVAPGSKVKVPQAWWAQASEETPDYCILLQDLGGLRTVNQLDGLGPDDTKSALTQLAQHHAEWWERRDALAELRCNFPISHEMYPLILPGLFDNGYVEICKHLDVPDIVHRIAPLFGGRIGAMLAKLGDAPLTLLHGDYRADNLMFDPDGSPWVLDWQITGAGTPAYDLGYFLSQSLQSDDLAAHEDELIGHYVSQLEASGVDPSTIGDLTFAYRLAVLQCLVYPVVAGEGIASGDPSAIPLYQEMLSRAAAAIDRLDGFDLLDEANWPS